MAGVLNFCITFKNNYARMFTILRRAQILFK